MSSAPHRARVVFFDLPALLEMRPEQPPLVRAQARRLFDEHVDSRFGILTEAPPALGRTGVLATLGAVGLDGWFDDGIVIDARTLPTEGLDRRALSAAAALAEVPIADCLLVTTEAALRRVANDAGMPIQVIAAPAADLAAGQVLTGELAASKPTDPDAAGLFILEGRIVTMDPNAEVIDRGRIVVDGGRIAAILHPGDSLASAYSAAKVVNTAGTIYPGLLDLHNHYVYDIAPLWDVPEAYHDRDEWPRAATKKSQISLPVQLLAGRSSTARAIARYVEAKALLGGTTTGQGIKTPLQGGIAPFRGAIRNVEAPGDPRLASCATRVPTISGQQAISDFARSLSQHAQKGGACFYHLAEGIDAAACSTYATLIANDLVKPPLAAIHALALDLADLRQVKAAGASIVWSPFSNLLLYGQTHDPADIADSGVRFAIGCDWSPTGSRNLLQELKVARHVVGSSGSLSSERLVRAVTSEAAAVAGWGTALGTIVAGALADLLVIRGDRGDPYDNLIAATEADVALVTVNGVARFGDHQLVNAAQPDWAPPPETFRVQSRTKAFQFAAHPSAAPTPIVGLTFRDAEALLRRVMQDLVRFKDHPEDFEALELGLGGAPFRLLLDMEPEVSVEAGGLGAPIADWTLLPKSLELDRAVVGGARYWKRVAGQRNLPQELKTALQAAYPN